MQITLVDHETEYFKSYFLKDFIYLFLERGEAREKEKEHRCARDTLIGSLSRAPSWGPGLKARLEP